MNPRNAPRWFASISIRWLSTNVRSFTSAGRDLKNASASRATLVRLTGPSSGSHWANCGTNCPPFRKSTLIKASSQLLRTTSLVLRNVTNDSPSLARKSLFKPWTKSR